jgi:hypothetical protein
MSGPEEIAALLREAPFAAQACGGAFGAGSAGFAYSAALDMARKAVKGVRGVRERQDDHQKDGNPEFWAIVRDDEQLRELARHNWGIDRGVRCAGGRPARAERVIGWLIKPLFAPVYVLAWACDLLDKVREVAAKRRERGNR